MGVSPISILLSMSEIIGNPMFCASCALMSSLLRSSACFLVCSSAGSVTREIALGVGGYPEGRIIEI